MVTDPNKPFLETPDIRELPEDKTGLYCFIDSARPCGAECMAYLSTRPEGRDYEGQQWAKCGILVSLHKGAKHVVALAGMGDSLLKHLRVKHADAVREKQSLPPQVK